MSLELLFLGTGTSAGVPMIGCDCDVCRSTDPRDQRTRPSVLIRYPDPSPAPRRYDGSPVPASPPRQFLIDAGPDMRVQLIRHRVHRLDGVLFTHTHADHVMGIDDLRRINAVMNGPVQIYAEPAALQTLRAMFFYIFESHRNVNSSFVATLIPQPIKPAQPLDLFGARWTPIRLLHGRLPILGFRVDYPADPADPDAATHSLAYCTDVSGIPPETYPLLRDLDVLVVDALRYHHHPTHMTVDQALGVIEQLGPRRAYLTHVAHDIQHADLEARLPDHVFLAFDGLTVDVPSIAPD